MIPVYPPEVLERSMAAAQSRGVPDGAIEILAGAFERLSQLEAAGKIGGDRGGKRAAGAVRARRFDARPPQLERLVGGYGNIHRLRSIQVAALQDYDARAEAQDPARC